MSSNASPQIVYDDRLSAPDCVHLAYARHHDIPVMIGLVFEDDLHDGDLDPLHASLCMLDIASGSPELSGILSRWGEEWPATRFVSDRMLDFSAINLAEIPLRLWMTGTTFQHQVWRVLLLIPRGSTTSYGEVAQRIGKPLASRAVGMACGANPVPLIVPCHRVLAANGGIGGYSGRGGVAFKQALLQREAELAA
ncbi:MAG: methylated-DNA--[protein]-cysteine S-methyltransferase [Bdellovibrionales bacterium]